MMACFSTNLRSCKRWTVWWSRYANELARICFFVSISYTHICRISLLLLSRFLVCNCVYVLVETRVRELDTEKCAQQIDIGNTKQNKKWRWVSEGESERTRQLKKLLWIISPMNICLARYVYCIKRLFFICYHSYRSAGLFIFGITKDLRFFFSCFLFFFLSLSLHFYFMFW